MRVTVLQAVGFLQPVRDHELFVGENLCGGSRGDDLSAIQQVDPAAEIEDELQVVRRNYAGGRETPYEAGQLSAAPGVKVARRLVQDKYARVTGKYACQTDPLLFAAAQVVRRSPLEPFEPHLPERLPDNPVDLRGRKSELRGTERHVFRDRGTEELVVRILEEEPDHSVHFVEIRVRDPFAADDNFPLTAVVLGEYPVQMEEEG